MSDSRSKASSLSSSAPTSASLASVSRLRASLFNPDKALKTSALTQHPDELLYWAGTYLEDEQQSLVKYALSSRSTYQALYPSIKNVLVKALKKLVEQDNTVQVRRLLRCHPYLQLQTEEGDPEGLAYKGIATTPYQDALADPMAEEMRGVLEEAFPGDTREERLAHAALQSKEFKDSCFDKIRKEKQGWMMLTRFAYKTWKGRYEALENNRRAAVHLPPLWDAWTRVAMVQNQWPKRLQKIFSTVSMDEKQTFKDLPVDLPEPHFLGDRNNRWYSDRVGCDLRLYVLPTALNLRAADFQAGFRRVTNSSPALIQQGEGATVTYYLYAPHIPLDRDESEWRCVPIDDSKVQVLIHFGHPTTDPTVGVVDFHQVKLPYSPLFEDLYKFGRDRELCLGSGDSDFVAVYNQFERRGAFKGMACMGGLGWAWQNFLAVEALFSRRAADLALHCSDLERYLPSRVQMRLLK